MTYAIEDADLLGLLKDLMWVQMPAVATEEGSTTRREGPNSTFVYLKHTRGDDGPKLLNGAEALVVVARAIGASVPELVAMALMHYIRRSMVVTIHPHANGFHAVIGAYNAPYPAPAIEHSTPGEALAKLGEKIDKDLVRFGFERITKEGLT